MLNKAESAATEAAVCLKKFPSGHVLGISDQIRDLRLFFSPELARAEDEYEKYVRAMRASGSPFAT